MRFSPSQSILSITDIKATTVSRSFLHGNRCLLRISIAFLHRCLGFFFFTNFWMAYVSPSESNVWQFHQCFVPFVLILLPDRLLILHLAFHPYVLSIKKICKLYKGF